MTRMWYLALLPPDSIRTEVRLIKEDVRERFGSGHALRSPAHITLIPPFRLDVSKEQELFDLLKAAAAEQDSISVRLEGFGHFSDRVIFIQVRTDQALLSLQAAFQRVFSGWYGRFPGPERSYHPHLTIAHRDLSPRVFEQAYEACIQQTFQREFRVNEISLLQHMGDHWEVFRSFPFRPGGLFPSE